LQSKCLQNDDVAVNETYKARKQLQNLGEERTNR